MYIVPNIENNDELCELYKEDVATFWITVLDTASDVTFFIVDGAHRWEVSKQLSLQFVYTQILRPEISVLEMVCLHIYVASFFS